MIARNPCEGVKGPGEDPVEETIFLTAADLNALAGSPLSISTDWIKYFVLKDPSWNISKLTQDEFERLYQISVKDWNPIFGTDNPDLTRFHMRLWEAGSGQPLSPVFPGPDPNLGPGAFLKQLVDDKLDRLVALIRRAATPPRPRRLTRPSAAARERRLAGKARRARLKQQRATISEE